ncbi:MAG: phosphoribosylanthranilate isomerase, partial [Pseudomonadota bacterium]
MPDTSVKICGLKTRDSVMAAVDAGAAYLGFNFVERSKRYVDCETARDLAVEVPAGIAKVALVLDADDATLDAITSTVPLDMLQLHGHEPPERVIEVKERYGLPVMKAIGIADESDLAELDVFSTVADQLLVDTKPPKTGDLPGGTG